MLKTKHRIRTKLRLKSENIQHLHISQLQYINGAMMNSPEPECSLRTAPCPSNNRADC